LSPGKVGQRADDRITSEDRIGKPGSTLHCSSGWLIETSNRKFERHAGIMTPEQFIAKWNASAGLSASFASDEHVRDG